MICAVIVLSRMEFKEKAIWCRFGVSLYMRSGISLSLLLTATLSREEGAGEYTTEKEKKGEFERER